MLYYLTDNKLIHVPKMLHFPVCVTFLKIYQVAKVIICVKFLQRMSQCFFTGTEMNNEDDMDIIFILFHQY